jgi:Uma2 family endonuclease
MTAFLDEESRLILWERRKRWTVEEYEKYFEQMGVDLWKVELIDGEIIPKMAKNRPHIIVLTRLVKMLGVIFGADYVQTEASVSIGDLSAPEPDLSIVYNAVTSYDKTTTASDVCLVVEVSDTTLSIDVKIKSVLYASGNIPEYWVVDIPNRQIIQYHTPQNDNYTTITAFSETDKIAPLLHPQNLILVSELLPLK